MTRLTTLFLAVASLTATAQTTYSISTTGANTFDPALVNAVVGDEIHLTIGGIHTFTEVDEATWNTNSNTSNGGYDFGAGTHDFTLDEPGTIYYVCIPHAGMGMKGRIIVSSGTGMADAPGASARPALFPNPASTTVRLAGNTLAGQRVEVLNIQGQVVLSTLLGTDATLDVSALPTGNYTVRVQDLQGTPVLLERLSIAR